MLNTIECRCFDHVTQYGSPNVPSPTIGRNTAQSMFFFDCSNEPPRGGVFSLCMLLLYFVRNKNNALPCGSALFGDGVFLFYANAPDDVSTSTTRTRMFE